MDHDVFTNEVIGEVTIDLKRLTRNEVTDEWYPLQLCPASTCRPSGSVRIRLLRTNNLLLSRIRHAQHEVESSIKQSLRVMRRLHQSIDLAVDASPTLSSYLQAMEDSLGPEGSPGEGRFGGPEQAHFASGAHSGFDVLDDFLPAMSPPGAASTPGMSWHPADRGDRVLHGGEEESKGAGEDWGSRGPAAASSVLHHGDAASVAPTVAASDAGDTVGGPGPKSGSKEKDSVPCRGRVIGHTLQVAVLGVEGVGGAVCEGVRAPRRVTNAGGHHKHLAPHWLYTTVRVGNAVRRSSVQALGFDVAFHATPLGLTFIGAPAVLDSGLVVNTVDTAVVSRAVHKDRFAVAASIVSGMVVCGVNGVPLAGLPLVDALGLLEAGVKRIAGHTADTLWLRFTTTAKLPQSDETHLARGVDVARARSSAVVVPLMNMGVSGVIGVDSVNPAARATSWERSATAAWPDVLHFGDSVAPVSAFVPLLNGFSPSLGKDSTMELCVVERAQASDGAFKLGLSDGPILGSGALVAIEGWEWGLLYVHVHVHVHAHVCE